MLPDDRVRLMHMIDAALKIERFIDGRSREDFEHDIQLQFAVARAIEIIGEAASKVSMEGRSLLPEFPWAQMIGIRNRLVHAYIHVDLDILWTTASESIPELHARLRALSLD